MKWYNEDGVTTKRSYPTLFGYRLRNILILVAIVLALIILILGLAVGLTLRNRRTP
jgi:hypothetical protein